MGWRDDPVAATGGNAWQHDPVEGAAPAPVPAAPTDDSALNAIGMGISKPFENLAKGLQAVLPSPVKASIDRFDIAMGQRTSDQKFAADDAARANNSRTGYQALGKMIGIAPTLAIPGSGVAGMAAQGAAGGLLTSDAKTGGEAVKDGLLGATGGVVGGGLLKGAGAILTPRVAPVIKYLDGLNIPTTIGQKMGAAGGFIGNAAKSIEDKLAGTFPIVGGAINAARSQGIEGLNRAITNHALAPIGDALPATVAAGHDAVAYAKSAFGKAYDSVLGQMQTHIDAPLQGAVADLKQRAAELPGDMSKTFNSIYDRVVGNRVDATTGVIPGHGIQMANQDLRTLAKSYGGSSTSSERQLGGLIGDLKDAFMGAASRNSAPGVGKALADTDNAYGNYVVLRTGAKNSPTGMMTPGQLQTAVRVSDQSVGKGATATGTARMQDLSKAATSVLPSKVGDSGTAARNGLMSMFGAGGAGVGALAGGVHGAGIGAVAPLAAGGLLSIPYSRAGQAVVNGLFSAPGTKRAAVAGAFNMAGRLAPGIVPPLLARSQ